LRGAPGCCAAIRRLADHDAVYASLLPMAATYEQAANDVDDLPGGFWSRTSVGPRPTPSARSVMTVRTVTA
jgi:hypothetical protein